MPELIALAKSKPGGLDCASTGVGTVQHVTLELLNQRAGIKINHVPYVTGFDFHRHPRPPGSRALADAWRPYVETCVEAFGAARCMFESNFPVDKGMYSYAVLWNAFKRLTAGAGAAEKTALFSGTAMRVYGLERLLAALSVDLAA